MSLRKQLVTWLNNSIPHESWTKTQLNLSIMPWTSQQKRWCLMTRRASNVMFVSTIRQTLQQWGRCPMISQKRRSGSLPYWKASSKDTLLHLSSSMPGRSLSSCAQAGACDMVWLVGCLDNTEAVFPWNQLSKLPAMFLVVIVGWVFDFLKEESKQCNNASWWSLRWEWKCTFCIQPSEYCSHNYCSILEYTCLLFGNIIEYRIT